MSLSIDELLNTSKEYFLKTGVHPFFISNWSDELPLNVDYASLLRKSFSRIKDTDLKKYYFSTDDNNYKSTIIKYYEESYNLCIGDNNFTLVPNGTSALYLILRYLRNNMNNVLALSPCYFSTTEALNDLNFEITYYPFIALNTFNLDDLRNAIILNKIQILVITDPIFGTGISLDMNTYTILLDLCKELNLVVIFDRLYATSQWNEEDHIFDKVFYQLVKQKTQKYFIVDSISKRLLTNGVKICIIYGNTKDIPIIEQMSVYMTGSFCTLQDSFYKTLYMLENRSIINNSIKNTLEIAQNTFHLINSFLLGKDMYISNADSSYFALIGIPRHIVKNKDDMSIAKQFITEKGIFLTPHSRYNYYDNDWFQFRINLLLEPAKIISTLSILSSL